MERDRSASRTEDEAMATFVQTENEFGVWHGRSAWIPGSTDPDTSSRVIQEPGQTYDGVKDFADLRVWQLGVDLDVLIYGITASFPQHERFGLSSQLQRAAVSESSNVAEGNARNRTADYLRFIAMARGSLSEVKTQLIISTRLGYIEQQEAGATLTQVDQRVRQLTALYSAIERSPRTSK